MQMHEHVLNFQIENSDAGEVYIDIAKCMSVVNRKLYRQQGLWHVHGACTYADVNAAAPATGTVGVPYTVAISGAARNWVTRNALVKAFETWKDQQKQAYDASGSSIKPKWQDFKVWLNKNHLENGDLLPTSGHMFGGPDAFNAGEWVHSKIVYNYSNAAGDVVNSEPELHIIGDDNSATSKGLILQYQESRAAVQSPDPVLDNAVNQTIYSLSEGSLGDQTEAIIGNIRDDNDEAPYDVDQYPGNDQNANEPVLYAFGANATTGKRKLALNGFAAPNGLLEIQYYKTVDPEVGTPGTGEFWIQLFVSHREAY